MIESLIQRIVWGGVYSTVRDGEGNERHLIFRAPTLRDKQFIEYKYTQAIESAKEQDCIGIVELTINLQKRGIWGKKEEDRIEFLTDKIIDTRDKIKFALNGRIAEMYEQAIGKCADELRTLQNQRHDVFQTSAEKQADSVRTCAVLFASTYNENDNRWWPTYKDFMDEQDSLLVSNMIAKLNEVEYVKISDIRRAARSSYWRMQWSAGKSVGDLFGKSIIELDAEQSALIYWSQIYDYVYEHPDKPDDEVIKNDKLLDEWFENEDRKKKVAKATDGGTVQGMQLGRNIGKHGEIFIVANPAMNPQAPTTQSIENLNTSMTRKFKAEETKRIQQQKLLKETELRNRRNKIARKIIGSSDAILKKGNLGGRSKSSQATRFPGGTIG